MQPPRGGACAPSLKSQQAFLRGVWFKTMGTGAGNQFRIFPPRVGALYARTGRNARRDLAHASATSFYVHHVQRIALAAQLGDARGIRRADPGA